MKIPMQKMAEEFPECYEVSNKLYALICPVLEKYEAPYSNAHHASQVLCADIIETMYLRILAQRGREESQAKGEHGEK